MKKNPLQTVASIPHISQNQGVIWLGAIYKNKNTIPKNTASYAIAVTHTQLFFFFLSSRGKHIQPFKVHFICIEK